MLNLCVTGVLHLGTFSVDVLKRDFGKVPVYGIGLGGSKVPIRSLFAGSLCGKVPATRRQ